MCGISGYFSKTASLNCESVIRMNNLISHRGPDDEGFYVFSSSEKKSYVYSGYDTPSNVLNSSYSYISRKKIEDHNFSKFSLILGHRRLSIVDVSPAGHQPMCSDDQKIWIVYNGEVYNYIELRDELIGLGHKFNTQSDTEVIIHAYKAWGVGCLSRFNGMFSFVIFDEKNQKLFIARDRFGVKPMYYWCSNEGIAFASEIKQFTALPGWKSQVNMQRAYDFLCWSIMDHTDETLFKDVYQLRGGQYSFVSLEQISQLTKGDKLPIVNWYTLNSNSFSGDFNNASEKFKELFIDSINLRLRADVFVGSCLSGGLDSSSIVCAVNKVFKDRNIKDLQKTFSACSDYKKVDESHYIDFVVDNTQTQSFKCTPDVNKVFELNEKIVWHQDEPFGSSSIYAQWNVFEIAAEQNVKVMLDGQGADEQLAGYDGYMFARLAYLLKRIKFKKFCYEFYLTRKYRGYSIFMLFAAVLSYLLPNFLRQVGRSLLGKSSNKPSWINFDKLKVIARDPMYSMGAIGDSIKDISFSQLTRTNLQMLLHWEDRDSMAHSIESRLPFLDYRLVEFVTGLPDEYKISDGITKKILRHSMLGILPEQVRMRMDKIGFATAEEQWLKSEATSKFRLELQKAIDRSSGIINPVVLQIFEDMVAGKRQFNYSIWRIISFSTWLEKFNVQIE